MAMTATRIGRSAAPPRIIVVAVTRLLTAHPGRSRRWHSTDSASDPAHGVPTVLERLLEELRSVSGHVNRANIIRPESAHGCQDTAKEQACNERAKGFRDRSATVWSRGHIWLVDHGDCRCIANLIDVCLLEGLRDRRQQLLPKCHVTREAIVLKPGRGGA